MGLHTRNVSHIMQTLDNDESWNSSGTPHKKKNTRRNSHMSAERASNYTNEDVAETQFGKLKEMIWYGTGKA